MASIPEISDPSDAFSQITPAYDIERSAGPERVNEPGYYGLPILKRPFWKWEIALYFFFEGISAGSYVLCSMAQLTRGARYSDVIRSGRYFRLRRCLPVRRCLLPTLGGRSVFITCCASGRRRRL